MTTISGQKEAVVSMVRHILPHFKMYEDIALVMLSKNELENLKAHIAVDIIAGKIQYSKDASNESEVVSYARSMVMNHLKKAKELNGNQVYGQTRIVVESNQAEKKLSSINLDISYGSSEFQLHYDVLTNDPDQQPGNILNSGIETNDLHFHNLLTTKG